MQPGSSLQRIVGSNPTMIDTTRLRNILAHNVGKFALLFTVMIALLVVALPLLSNAPVETLVDRTGKVMKTVKIEKTPFRKTISARGEIDSQEKSTLRSEVDDKTTILWLVPAGTQVSEPLRSDVRGSVRAVRHTDSNTSVI